MPDIIVNPSAVVVVQDSHPNPQYQNGVAAVTVQAGQCVALDDSKARYDLASAIAETNAAIRGICTHAASPGQPVKLLLSGLLDLGAEVLTVGELYAVSATPGRLVPVGEVLSGQYVSVVGVGQTSNLLQVRQWVTGLAKG